MHWRLNCSTSATTVVSFVWSSSIGATSSSSSKSRAGLPATLAATSPTGPTIRRIVDMSLSSSIFTLWCKYINVSTVFNMTQKRPPADRHGGWHIAHFGGPFNRNHHFSSLLSLWRSPEKRVFDEVTKVRVAAGLLSLAAENCDYRECYV